MFDTIAIIGLGYVGLPLSIRFAENCTTVIGIDIDPAKIDILGKGRTYIKHIDAGAISKLVRAKKFLPTTDFAKVKEADAVIICVPTPLTKTREPDLSYVLDTGRAIAPHLKRGTLVVLESTSYPGTTDEDLRAVLEQNSSMPEGIKKAEMDVKLCHVPRLKSGNGRKALPRPKAEISDPAASPDNFEPITDNPRPKGRVRMVAGRDFHLAFSPEREDPGNPNSSIGKIPKIVGGYTPQCRDEAVALYSRAVEKVVPVSSCKVAEAAKLLENIFRSVNIALVNELKMIYAAMGIDIWEVIEAAKTKPFGFMPFYPGPGLGGHCIPIDPFYLAWKAREFGKHTRFIELAGEINTAMPQYVIQQLIEALNSYKKSVNGSKVLVVGLAYKPDVDDMRESPTFVLLDLLKARGAQVAYYDPHVPEIGPTREHGQWQGMKSIEWKETIIRSFDAVIIATSHSATNHQQLAEWCDCVVDTRNALPRSSGGDSGRVWPA